MGTFGERLRDAALVVDIRTASALSRRNQVSTQTALTWLSMTEANMGAIRLLRLCDIVKVRVRWLAEGTGPATPVTTAPAIEEAIRIADGLTKERLETWLEIGQWLIDHPQVHLLR